jgi:hypothetical protein
VSFTGLDIAAFAEASIAGRVQIAEEIAAEVADEYPTVRVEIDGPKVSATTYGSFDHLREWGSVNNSPRGRMRSAAVRAGDFRPEGK